MNNREAARVREEYRIAWERLESISRDIAQGVENLKQDDAQVTTWTDVETLWHFAIRMQDVSDMLNRTGEYA